MCESPPPPVQYAPASQDYYIFSSDQSFGLVQVIIGAWGNISPVPGTHPALAEARWSSTTSSTQSAGFGSTDRTGENLGGQVLRVTCSECSMRSDCRNCRNVRGGDGGPHKALFDLQPESRGMSYCRLIASKNSEFVLVAFRRSMRNSIAATSSIGASSLRRIHTF